MPGQFGGVTCAVGNLPKAKCASLEKFLSAFIGQLGSGRFPFCFGYLYAGESLSCHMRL